jgi:hypothetical protein
VFDQQLYMAGSQYVVLICVGAQCVRAVRRVDD